MQMLIKNFPRGGKISSTKSSDKLGRRRRIKPNKLKKKKSFLKKALAGNPLLSLNGAENLKLDSLCKGMMILGRIIKVTEYYTVVLIPGQISGILLATDISKSYTNLLRTKAINKGLSSELRCMTEIYKKGDYIICYIKEVYSNFDRISLSIEPELLNQKLNPKFLMKYSKVVFNVNSIEDHGYVLETGLKNFRAFLSMKDVENKETIYYTGKQIICAIKSLKTAENTFVAQVSVKDIYMNNVESNIRSLDNFYPGVKYFLNVKKILNNGLQVYFGNKKIGYINQFYLKNELSFYKKSQGLIGILLYVLPNINLGYFSLLPQDQEKKFLKIGEIISNVRVKYHGNCGVFVQMEKDIRGFIPLKYTETIGDIHTFQNNSFVNCKVIAYDFIAKLYICRIEQMVVKQINVVNIQPGDILEVIIIKVDESTGYVTVLTGNLYGYVPPDQVFDYESNSKPRIGDRVSARVLEFSVKLILSLKRSIIESRLPVLCKIEDAVIGSIYHGTVIKIIEQGILVRFFNNTKGWIPKRFLNYESALKKENLFIGQTITTVVMDVNIKDKKIILALPDSTNRNNLKYNIGDIVEGTVIDSSEDGLYLQLQNENQIAIAYLPAGHMSLCYPVGKLLAIKTVVGDVLSAIVFSNHPNLILSTTLAPVVEYKMEDLNCGDCILCSVQEIQKESVKVVLPILNCKYGTVPISNVQHIETVHKNQILFGKIIKIDKRCQELTLSTQLNKVYRGFFKREIRMMIVIDILSSYLYKLSDLSKNIYYAKKFSKISIGKRIKGIIEKVTNNGLLVKVERNIRGIVHIKHYSGSYKEGDGVEGAVLWIDYPGEYVVLTLLKNIMNTITIKQNKLIKIPLGEQLRGEILLITDWFILVVLKGQAKGILVALPVRKHLNDNIPNLLPYNIGDKVRCYGILNKEDANILLSICMLKSLFEMQRKVQYPINNYTSKSNIPSVIRFKRNIVNEKMKFKNNIMKQMLSMQQENTANKNNLRGKTEIFSELNLEEKLKIKENKPHNIFGINLHNFTIPESGFEWKNLKKVSTVLQDCFSSSDEGVENIMKYKEKKKSINMHETDPQKENRLHEDERSLFNYLMPHTVDQFDRILLSSSDSSIVWIQYMTYHLQSTDIDGARTVVRRALRTINFCEEIERLNVLKAWLNLESTFGSRESLHQVFQEAITVTDIKKIYAHMLLLHSVAGRHNELQNIVKNMITKFNQNVETWIDCGYALLKSCMKDESRYIMHRALQSLPVNKHVHLLIGFAKLENEFGDVERSQTLFEQVINAYPKRIYVWCCYLGSLLRSGNLKMIRKILDRAITQDIPIKKLISLFKKYATFDKQYETLYSGSQMKEFTAKLEEKL